MLVLQVPPTSLIPKMATIYLCRENCLMYIYCGGKNIPGTEMEKPGKYDHFPEGTGYRSFFLIISTNN